MEGKLGAVGRPLGREEIASTLKTLEAHTSAGLTSIQNAWLKLRCLMDDLDEELGSSTEETDKW